MKTIYIVLKVVVSIASIIAIYFASHFWMGSKEDWDFAIKDRLIEFAISRFIFTLSIGSIFFSISLLLNRIFRKHGNIKRLWFLELVILIIASFLFVIAALSGLSI